MVLSVHIARAENQVELELVGSAKEAARRCIIANPIHLEILQEGVEAWNRWRKDHPEIKPDLRRASLTGMHLNKIDLRGANLIQAQLNGVFFNETRLEGALLDFASLEGAHLQEAHLEGASLKEAYLGGADLRGIFLSKITKLEGAQLFSEKLGAVSLVDADWGDVNLGTIDWEKVKVIGDERAAREAEHSAYGVRDSKPYHSALRCYRQLSMELRRQGLGEEADHFAYRGHLLQRVLLRSQKKWLRWFFSCVLDHLAGYGYKPGRSLAIYLAVLLLFTFFFHFIPNSWDNGIGSSSIHTPLAWADAFLFSLVSFHGRVNAPPSLMFNGLYAWISISETLLGLVVELSFIAAFTQRFLGGK